MKRIRKFAGYYNYSIPYNSFSGGSNNAGLPYHSTSSASSRSAHGSTSHVGKNKRTRQGSDENEGSEYPGSPPRKGRKREFHDGDPCGPCSVWIMTGCDERVKEKHKHQPIMRHPIDKASCEGVQIVLQPDSCLCEACYRDCWHKTDKPRWVSIQSALVDKNVVLVLTLVIGVQGVGLKMILCSFGLSTSSVLRILKLRISVSGITERCAGQCLSGNARCVRVTAVDVGTWVPASKSKKLNPMTGYAGNAMTHL